MFEEQQLDPNRRDRKAFCCGEPVLDRFLKQQAHQNMRRGVSQTFVLVTAEAPGQIAGFYTLAPAEITLADLQPGDAKTPAAVAFYAHHGFRPFQDTPRSLYLPL